MLCWQKVPASWAAPFWTVWHLWMCWVPWTPIMPAKDSQNWLHYSD